MGRQAAVSGATVESLVLIPSADRATIEPSKLRDYLLSPTHPVGRFKARFFTALGFDPERWEELELAFRLQHLTREGEPAGTTAHGRKYTIRAILSGPTGQSARVTSVWFVPSGGDVPRFVTAYPGDTL
jgi:hypothetical protein